MEVLQAGQQEDWLLDSLEKYEGIYMYELQYPSTCLEWNEDGSSVWLAAMAEGGSSEILQLALPEHLLPADKKTLWAKRDFKLINGAFVKSRVTALKCIPSSQNVVSASVNGKVEIWTGDKDKADLLQSVDEINLKQTSSTSVLLDVSPFPPTLLLTATTSDLYSLQVHDLTTKKTLYQLTPPQDGEPRPLHDLSFLPRPQVFVTCSSGGQLDMWDLRGDTPTQPIASTTPTKETTPTDCYSVALGDHTHPGSQLAVLASSGQLELYDPRQLQRPQARCQFQQQSTTAGACGSRFSSEQGQHFTSLPCVNYSGPHTISVSGVSKGVKIYDTSDWSCDTSDPTPLFAHCGHEAESAEVKVLVHSWQPAVSGKTVLSVDSGANLHAWQPAIHTQ